MMVVGYAEAAGHVTAAKKQSGRDWVLLSKAGLGNLLYSVRLHLLKFLSIPSNNTGS